jgi:hypothetical protein
VPARWNQADELYTLAELARMVKVQPERLLALVEAGEMLGPDVFIPGGGPKGRRWSASRVHAIQRKWLIVPEAVPEGAPH